MQVQFRECDFFNIWIWLRFSSTPSNMERQYIEEVFDSWFFLGKLGGFNAENLQVQEEGMEISYFTYTDPDSRDTLSSLMHNMGEMEYEGVWARCWFDLGTTDAIALDILINALTQFSRDYVTVEEVIIGGDNSDWPIPDSYRADFIPDTDA
ncbi:DUF3531 family protein [Leptolyngbya sp. PCC 6406]|uniref:DUF3531 family protein n=1 Tax=Leptolyngbya sp. PCC 6406 TaxID=1173264 RepID=UPI0002ABB83D|nr:DUF3531 family protein [Leptolyngbya sp. PCC 6406]